MERRWKVEPTQQCDPTVYSLIRYASSCGDILARLVCLPRKRNEQVAGGCRIFFVRGGSYNPIFSGQQFQLISVVWMREACLMQDCESVPCGFPFVACTSPASRDIASNQP